MRRTTLAPTIDVAELQCVLLETASEVLKAPADLKRRKTRAIAACYQETGRGRATRPR